MRKTGKLTLSPARRCSARKLGITFSKPATSDSLTRFSKYDFANARSCIFSVQSTPSITSTCGQSLNIVDKSVLPLLLLHVTSRTSGHDRRIAWAQDGSMIVRICGYLYWENASRSGVVILEGVNRIRKVCRLGNWERQRANRGNTVSASQLVRDTVIFLVRWHT